MTTDVSARHLARFDQFVLDRRAGELFKDGAKVKLQDQPLRLLEMLLDRPGDIVSREELRQGLWNAETFVDFEGGLNTAVNKLRAALGDTAENSRFVETVGRRGYRFIAHVEPSSSAVEPRPASPREGVRRGWVPAAAVAVMTLVAAVAILAWRARAKNEEARASIRSLAVLPFVDISAGADAYVADGMTDALITEVSKIRALKVISQTSAMRYKGTTKPLPEIARELGVNAVLEGSVLRSGQRVRVTANLIRAGSDEHLWAQDYERDLGDVLSMQREVARAVAAEVRVRLTPEESARLANARPVDAEASDSYLQGVHYAYLALNQPKAEASLALLEKSCAFYQDAIRRAPHYAKPHAGLAGAYGVMASDGFPEFWPRAKAEAERAIALDDTLANAHGVLAGTLFRMDKDWAGAEREYLRVMDLDPAVGHLSYASFLSAAGRIPEAIDHIERAAEFDPRALRVANNAGIIYMRARRYDRAEETFRRALEEFPGSVRLHTNLGRALVLQGRSAEGIAEIRKVIDSSPDSWERRAALVTLAWALALSGRTREARAMLPQLEALADSRPAVSPVGVATVYAALGDTERAFAQLERAFQRIDGSLPYVNTSPWFDPLRADPRFADIIRRTGVPESRSGTFPAPADRSPSRPAR